MARTSSFSGAGRNSALGMNEPDKVTLPTIEQIDEDIEEVRTFIQDCVDDLKEKEEE